MDLEFLVSTRNQYEACLMVEPGEFHRTIERLPDRELELAHHVFVVRCDDRAMQITVEDEVVPTAFLKRVGVDDEWMLLQVIVDSRDLKIQECRQLYKEWIVKRSTEANLQRLASSFR